MYGAVVRNWSARVIVRAKFGCMRIWEGSGEFDYSQWL